MSTVYNKNTSATATTTTNKKIQEITQETFSYQLFDAKMYVYFNDYLIN